MDYRRGGLRQSCPLVNSIIVISLSKGNTILASSSTLIPALIFSPQRHTLQWACHRGCAPCKACGIGLPMFVLSFTLMWYMNLIPSCFHEIPCIHDLSTLFYIVLFGFASDTCYCAPLTITTFYLLIHLVAHVWTPFNFLLSLTALSLSHTLTHTHTQWLQ